MTAWKEALVENDYGYSAPVLFSNDNGGVDGNLHDAARVPDPDYTELVEFTPDVPRFIEFITHDAGRQMIGSFHPKDGDYFRDAYFEMHTV
jgi:hypothetical protein